MIKVQDHIHNASGMRDSSLVLDEISKTDELDKLALWMDYNIEQRFRGYEPVPFEVWKTNKWVHSNDNMHQWYLWHFQKI